MMHIHRKEGKASERVEHPLTGCCDVLPSCRSRSSWRRLHCEPPMAIDEHVHRPRDFGSSLCPSALSGLLRLLPRLVLHWHRRPLVPTLCLVIKLFTHLFFNCVYIRVTVAEKGRTLSNNSYLRRIRMSVRIVTPPTLLLSIVFFLLRVSFPSITILPIIHSGVGSVYVGVFIVLAIIALVRSRAWWGPGADPSVEFLARVRRKTIAFIFCVIFLIAFCANLVVDTFLLPVNTSLRFYGASSPYLTSIARIDLLSSSEHGHPGNHLLVILHCRILLPRPKYFHKWSLFAGSDAYLCHWCCDGCGRQEQIEYSSLRFSIEPSNNLCFIDLSFL